MVTNIARDELVVRGQGLAAGVVMRLPARLQRLLAGAAVVSGEDELAVDLQLMLRVLGAGPTQDPGGLSVEKLRAQFRRAMIVAGGSHPIGSVEDLRLGDLPARLYRPRAAARPDSLVVFFHGGGFMVGDLDSYEAVCRFLAEEASVPIVSVEYRLAPEHPFPAAHDDALAAFEWVHAHAAELGADPARIGVAGDSAGGNLAATVALAAGKRCAGQFLFYPATTSVREYPSRRAFGSDFLLTEDFIAAALRHYEGESAPRDRHRAEPLHAPIPGDQAPALIATAGFDPLRDEGEAYAERLVEAGVDADLRRFGGQIHGFLSLIGISATARGAGTEVARAMRARIHGGETR